MEEIKNKIGEFWIDNEENKFIGEIEYENNQFYLNLKEEHYGKEYKNTNIIKGIIENTPISLYKCHLIDNDPPCFLCAFLFKNYADNNLTFKNAEIEINNFENWIRKHVVKKKFTSVTFTPSKKEYKLDNFKLTLFFNKNVHKTMNRFTVKNKFKIKIEYDENKAFEEILKDLNIITTFLSICMYKQTNIKSLILEDNIEVFYQFFNDAKDTLNFHDILIHYNTISDEFGTILNKWFEIHDVFKNAIYLYFMNITYKTNAETMFLTYSQALEAFIRKNNNFNKFYMDFNEYDKIKEEFYDCMGNMELDRDHRRSLKSRIKYGNEFSLRKRLKMLINYLGEYELINVLTDRYHGKFINYIVDTRNYYTHYGDIGKYKTSGGELLLLAYDLKLILELCLLHELKLPPDLINLILSKKIDNIKLL